MTDSPEKKNCVLVIDDEVDGTKPLLHYLKRSNYEALYAEASAAALSILAERVPDIILIDVVLGRNERGFDLFAKIKEMPALADTPILFMSGLGEAEDRISGLKLGAVDYIVKPYDLREVLVRISLHIRIHQDEKLLGEQNKALAVAYEELRSAQDKIVQQEKLAAIGRLSAGIAHEMATPLSFIISDMKMLSEYLRDMDRVLGAYHDLAVFGAGRGTDISLQARAQTVLGLSRQMDLDRIKRELQGISTDCLEGAELIGRIANDLREFSRDENEGMQDADLNVILDKALNLARNEMGERVTLERDYQPLPPVACVPVRMTQLFLILLVNATQAISGKGTVLAASRFRDGRVWISITDTGSGIPSDSLERVMEPFFTTKPAGKGMGLGLSIAQKILTAHGGSIAIESEVGVGTTVRVSLPPSSKTVEPTGADAVVPEPSNNTPL